MIRPPPRSAPRVLAPIAFVAFAVASAPARAGDPSTADCLAASDASIDAANAHKLRAERAQLLVCASASCPADIRRECVRRVEEVNAQLPTILFDVRDASGGDLVGVAVTMDGERLAERLEGVALPVDPGEHTFSFEAVGLPALTKKLLVREGEKDRRERVVLAPPPPGPAPVVKPPSPPSPEPAAPSRVTAEPAAPTTLGAQRTIALVLGGVGVLGVGVGAVFGVTAMSRKSDAQAACPGACATSDGVTKWSDAASAGNASTVAFVLGGVALAGGAVLWFTAPSGSAFHVAVAPGGVRVGGTW